MSTRAVDLGVCDLCGPAPGEVLLRGGDRRHGAEGSYAVVRCAVCGLGRTHPHPEDLGAAYPDGDYMNHRERVDLVSRIFSSVLRRTATGAISGLPSRAALVAVPAARLGGPLEAGARILDVGCGSGHAVAALREVGVDAHGLEPSAKAVERARRSGLETVRRGTLETTELDDGAWDLVRFWHTLEHTPSPSEALGRALRGLRPGGRIVVGVPNLDAAARVTFGADWDGLELPRHLHHFTRSSLRAMLRRVGFDEVNVRSVAVMGVLAGSIDARTRRDGRQRRGTAWAIARPALHPVELLAAAVGRGDGLVATAVKP